MAENGRQRLTSWKEIAAYVGRDVRTVLRWEKQRGLPVHRVPGATGRVVFAYPDELDAWIRGATPDFVDVAAVTANQSAVSTRSRRIVPAAIAAGLMLTSLAAAAWLTRRAPGAAAREVASVECTETSIRALAADGAELWTYRLERRLEADHPKPVIADLNGDGHADVAISLIVKDPAAGGFGQLLAIDARGRKMWQHEAQDRLRFGSEIYGPAWDPDGIVAYTAGGQQMIAWAFHHHTWWPSILAVFNGRGERTGTFVNSGWIRNVAASTSGRYLLAGGISNARNGAAFAILDARQPNGASPEDQGSRYECRNCPDGAPIRYFVVPWTDIIEPMELGGRRGQFTSQPDGSIEMRAVQRLNAEFIVELTPSFEIKSRRFSDGFWLVHAQMERDGILKHSRENCPFRKGPSIFEWMPEHGWRELRP